MCRKLGLKEGERVLDVGCGWGSFAIHAAQNYGVEVLGVTLSERQVELGRERCRGGRRRPIGSSFESPTTASWPAQQFDAISSIGMVEHVGEERIDLYMRSLNDLLRPGGRLLNHGIAKLMDFDTKDEGAFSERFVFPDGVPLPLSRIELALERAGLVTRTSRGCPTTTRRRSSTGSRASSRATTRPSAWPGSSAPGSGGSTCARPGRASSPAGPPSTRSWPTSPSR